MASEQAIRALLSDPLAATTRGKRKALLSLALVTFGVVKAGLVPTSVGTLGIDLSTDDQKALLWLLFLVVLYFLVAFVLYASRDALLLRADYLGLVDKELVQRGTKADEIEQRAMQHSISFWGKHRWLAGTSKATALFRLVLLDLLFPVILGTYSLCILWGGAQSGG